MYYFYLFRDILSASLMKNVYTLTVQYHLRYYNVTWGGLYDELMNALSVVYKYIIEVMLCLDIRHPAVLHLWTVRIAYIKLNIICA